jgi:hypothetical protein
VRLFNTLAHFVAGGGAGGALGSGSGSGSAAVMPNVCDSATMSAAVHQARARVHRGPRADMSLATCRICAAAGADGFQHSKRGVPL